MANTFRKNPIWDAIMQKDIKCSMISRTKMDPRWLYAVGSGYYSIVKKDNKYGIAARADKEDEYVGVCACKYESIFPLNVFDDYRECNYAYFAVMKNGKYGVYRLESSNEISEQIYGREVVKCKYDQIAPIKTNRSIFNVILLLNIRTEINEYNEEVYYMEMSYYNGFTDRISDVYRNISAVGNSLECYKLFERGYLINLFDDSIIYKSSNNLYYQLICETEKWVIFLEGCSEASRKKRLIFYNIEEKDTFVMDNLKNVQYFSKNGNVERIVTTKDETEQEIMVEDAVIKNVVIKHTDGAQKFYYN